MRYKSFVVITLLSLFSVSSFASLTDSTYLHHEVRVGWGDMLFETAVFHDSPRHFWANPEAISPEYSIMEKYDHAYTGHFFAEYQYNFKSWLALGFQVDFEGIFWKETTYDRYHSPISGTTDLKNYDLSLMPILRFTYFRGKWVNLYSNIGGGMLIAFDNQRECEIAPVFTTSLFSVSVGQGHWFGSVELGLMGALLNQQKIYMLGSRLFNVSLSYKF